MHRRREADGEGISRRVVVVESPDQRYFEQAIFIVRNEAVGEGVTARELVEEAAGWPGTMPAATMDGSAGPGGTFTPAVYTPIGAGVSALRGWWRHW